ncbi:MAG: (2,3-dihydroxybenzoyl)adenylate synthase [Armatimonadetes bacterium]|nr:(2,3-dihydroxybenzoyl)adenylate synthase [Armatimonadota bacterium]
MAAGGHAGVLEERTTLRTVVLALGVLLVGLVLLYLASNDTLWRAQSPWQSMVRQLGSVLTVTVVIALLWNLWGKRAFVDELFAKARIAEDIQQSGIVGFTESFQRSIDWESLFRSGAHLDICFAYGRTWRNSHRAELQALAKRPEARIRVVLPDPDDTTTVAEMARRFDVSAEQFSSAVREAAEDFTSLGRLNPENRHLVQVWYLPATLQFSFYRFGTSVVFALYTHRKERAPVPAFVIQEGGSFYEFVRAEFRAMVEDDPPLARRAPEGG